ncbi:uncharacterized protein TRIREDRAFT_56572 [Trichoderma reesei QM6a]|jgi:aspartate/methionine/tyrosine aminotransferase|uniref:Predicted protein n=2 Tax=Hypocrea jecorina TaxID=51453 RepID=G0RBX4_HYPJQ|nr:uncharacterized protein TRIREDRAFT_56572 [Trichoderma reesei QM6a]EGR51401.1 predicted protein [Trichoderma reesei QM6a]ETS04662.1 putative aminotransferase [Trichoderma reesei RUT C-30]
MSLSSRASKLTTPDPSFSILTNPYHPTLNPSGHINLAVAENTLMHASLQSHLHSHLHVPTSAFTYGDFFKRSRSAIATFLTKHLHAVSPIKPEHVAVVSGCTAAVEHISWALADPGDLILLGRPYYGAFPWDATIRTGAKLAYVDFGDEDPLGDTCVKKYEDRILEAKANGENVTALLLCHPHNPLGRCYPLHVLIDLLKLCNKHKLHLISDEIYALSVFENTVDAEPPLCHPPAPFHSVLSIDLTGLIDPAYVHVIWGMSKDFGANGLRLGAIISQHNIDLMTALFPLVLLTSVSSLTEHVLANILEDDAWVETYIKENQRKLSTYYKHITTWAKTNDIVYAPGVNAGFFIWADLGRTFRKHRKDEPEDLDQAVMDALLRHKVFLASGARFGSEKPGWFRIVFSHEREYLDEGLRRIVAAVTTPEPLEEARIDLRRGSITAEDL